MLCNPLLGKQESQESIQESQNQDKIPKDSRITSVKVRVADPSPLGLRKKHTDKLNFNFMKILEKSCSLVTNSWFTKSTTLYYYKFQHTYFLNHVALENLSPVLASVPSCHAHVILRAAKIIVCAQALYSTFVASRSITLAKELLAR